MHKEIIYKFGILALVVFFLVSLSGCRTSAGVSIGDTSPGPAATPSYDKGGPPPWAPAHGNRAKHSYRYYSYHGIYFEEKSGVYFYYSDGKWQASVSLPSSIRITVSDFVTLEMDTDRPYEYHNDVVKKYPPGQQKNKGRGQNQENKKGNKKGN